MAISNATRLANYVGAAITADGNAGIITAQTFIGNLTGTASSASVSTNAYGLTGTPNIDVGIVTAVQFSGNITGTAATFTGNVSIAGTLTYEDVTNIDSIGIITARSGILVNSGGINVTGVVTATSFVGSGSGLTDLNIPASYTELDSMLFG